MIVVIIIKGTHPCPLLHPCVVVKGIGFEVRMMTLQSHINNSLGM